MHALERPIRAAVFEDVQQTRSVVTRLLAAGFSRDQITVICSEESKQRHFAEFAHQEPAGAHLVEGAAAGSTIGAILGGVAVATLTGGVALAAGGLALWSGAVVGGLVGAMMTRGIEKELADHYAQAVSEGKLLVAAETEDPLLQRKAEEIFALQGAEPRELPEEAQAHEV